MLIKDKVYKEIRISEPVLIELIKSPPLQRLKNIDQSGYFEPYFPGAKYSRFEHSVGVCALLKMYRAPIEEQIAGLIHDVSHSAFSHCIDYVLGDDNGKKQSHQDDIHEKFVQKSEIPKILKKHGFDVNYILNDKNFPLKETVLPNLCADRIDYSLRSALAFREINNTDYFLKNLVVENSKWIFKNFESAKKYANLFLNLNKKYWAGLPAAIMLRTVGDYLKYALSKRYISKDDLYTTDKLVLSKIKPRHKTDAHLKLLFARMNNKIGFSNNQNNFNAKVFCKSRVVDPLCFHHGKIRRVSEIKSNWAAILMIELKPKQYFIKFEK